LFPIRKATLSLLEIADYWSREIQPPATKAELLRDLARAWWLGEIPSAAPARRELLKRMFSARNNPDLGIVFIAPGEAVPRTVHEFPDGTAMVDLTPKVHVPASSPDAWDEGSCEDAFREIAQISTGYLHLNYGLAFLELDYDEFTHWLAQHGYTRPKFWRPFQEHTRQEGGIKARSIEKAIGALWSWNIPQGLTAKERNNKIIKWLNENGCSVPQDPARAIQRVIKGHRLAGLGR